MPELIDIDELLHKAVQRRASDVHLTAGLPPIVRIDGRLVPTEYDRILPPTSQKIIYSMLTDQQKQAFEQNFELDFSYGVAGLGRFRVHLRLGRRKCLWLARYAHWLPIVKWRRNRRDASLANARRRIVISVPS